jgi:hypothetical protein
MRGGAENQRQLAHLNDLRDQYAAPGDKGQREENMIDRAQ